MNYCLIWKSTTQFLYILDVVFPDLNYIYYWTDHAKRTWYFACSRIAIFSTKNFISGKDKGIFLKCNIHNIFLDTYH